MALHRRRIYVLPTRSGVFFALVLLAMLVGAINYGSSLSFALTFLLGSLGMVSILHTFKNLHRLRFRAGRCAPVFAGQEAAFPIAVENVEGPRFAVEFTWPGHPTLVIDLAGEGSRWVELPVKSARRGRLPSPPCTVSTRYPLGLFRAWGHVHLQMECLVYPHPAEEKGLPEELFADRSGSGDRGNGSDDFAALRPYRPGDSLRHVHWKAVARGQAMLVKQFGGERAGELWLHWDALPGLDPETRLARLCRWVLEADAADCAYGLALPGRRIDPARGEGHRRRCLEALALHGEAPAPEAQRP